MPTLVLRNPETGVSCEIESGCGLVHVIEAAHPRGLEALLDGLLEVPGTQVVHGVGGMVSNINVLENIALPAIYFGLARSREFDSRVIEAFGACGVDGARAEALCRMYPGELNPFDRRLAGFLRALLLQPDILVYYRFFEGLTGVEMEQGIALDAVYRGRCPQGTSVYLSMSDLPTPQIECDRRNIT